MEDSDSSSTPIFIIFFIFCILMVCHHQTELDEFGRDSYDRYYDVPGRDRWGYIVNEDGTYSFWGNLFDTNPYYSW